MRKFKIFISVGVSGSKAAPPIRLNNGGNFTFNRYLNDPVVSLSFLSILSIFKLIFGPKLQPTLVNLACSSRVKVSWARRNFHVLTAELKEDF